jgi:hypothetical protein
MLDNQRKETIFDKIDQSYNPYSDNQKKGMRYVTPDRENIDQIYKSIEKQFL